MHMVFKRFQSTAKRKKKVELSQLSTSLNRFEKPFFFFKSDYLKNTEVKDHGRYLEEVNVCGSFFQVLNRIAVCISEDS